MATATTYSKSNILKSVKVILDLNETNTVLTGIGDIDQLQTDGIIEKCMEFALDRVVSIAPLSYLAGMYSSGDYTPLSRYSSGSNRFGKYIEIDDDDFVRIISVFCDDWTNPVYEFITPYDNEYLMQSSPLEGVRGNSKRPVVAVLNNPTSPDTIIVEIYDTDAEDEGCHITYIAKTKFNDNGSLDMNPQIFQAYIYMVASLYYNTLLQKDASELMALKAVESLNIDINSKNG